jgi:hypothetical protein
MKREKREKIEGVFFWYEEKNKDLDFSSIKYIDGPAYLQGCSLNLSSLEIIGGSAYLRGCSEKLKKSLAKTLKECGGIYIEFRDKPLTLEEFKQMYGENPNPKEIVINGATYVLKD